MFFACVETDCDEHLWASGDCFCWNPCKLPLQWTAPSGGENCHGQKGTWQNRPCKKLFLIVCLVLFPNPNPFSILHNAPRLTSFFCNKIANPRIKCMLNWWCCIPLSGTHLFLTNSGPAEEVSRLWWNNHRRRFYHQVWREPSTRPRGHSGHQINSNRFTFMLSLK